MIGEGRPPRGEWDFNGLQLGLRESDHVITAWCEGELIGFASASAEDDTVGLSWLFVRSDYRRQGIGKELLTRLLARFPECTVADVIANQASATFYRSCGFVPAPHVMPMIKDLTKGDSEQNCCP